ncbi:hypothetical protein [Methylobacterium dankookense]|uniref:Uncharacterized protein n=1 Tax=Methylobacterium dankookense TaxID=560405 RepID=A0A564G6P7_9HYPH|nr:hypothetical protein [Methylobacterium dankookense]GJD55200.1 hypothetical protein IFDJLNFL_1083 [Methylobacterium dankookense]VUF15221.1 hypothetical protein MTDSW087_04957 [Methylobacterium dankookense]
MPQTAANKEADALLKPVFKSFKRQAVSAIREAQAKIADLLRVSYDAPAVARPDDLPAPRLQLRWEETQDGSHPRVCHYELVFPLHQHDIRNDPGTGYAVVQLGRTMQGGADVDWDTCDLADRTPFRDGVHAQWDAAVFGGLPTYIIAPTGRHALVKLSAEKLAAVEKQVASLLAKRAA